MKMLRTCWVMVGLAVVFHDLSSSSGGGGGGGPYANAQGDSSTKKPTSMTTAPRAGSGEENAKVKLTKLEKAEEEVDKEFKKETARRENATSTSSSTSSYSSASSDVVTPKVEVEISGNTDALCNNALHADFTIPGSVALCTCGIDEVLVNGTCQHTSETITILAEKHVIFTAEFPIKNYRVRVQDVVCKNLETHRNMTFEKGTFYLRNRGDIVLTDEAAKLVGLRINDYCVDHYLDETGNVSSRMKACIPHPVVPRCCPAFQVMVNGTCSPGPSPLHLYPPITADPRGGKAITWPFIKNQVNTLKCGASEAIKSVASDVNGSYMLALGNGLSYRLYSNGPNGRSEFKFCPDFCVDGRQTIDGVVDYTVHFCYTPEKSAEEKVCKSGSCLRKCCKPGEIMSVDHYRCMKSKEAKFDPPVVQNITDYEVIVGKPTCAVHLAEIEDSIVDEEGKWTIDTFSLESNLYCMDTFARKGTTKMMALICLKGNSISLWWEVRRIIFPVCHVISLIFLGITVAFHLLAPILLKQEGWHQLSYVISLMVAYAFTFSLNVYHDQLTRTGCVGMALLMQLGFMSTFFWLTVMCFDIERKIRSLRHFRAYAPLHPLVYAAFGFGGPAFIGIVTLIMHATVPYGSKWLISPAIGLSRCWFHSDLELLVYFYGPVSVLFVCNIGLIASTGWNYMKIERGALGMAMKSQSSENGQSSQQPPLEYDRQKQTKKNFADFKHTFLLLSLMCFCWVTEVLSWRIRPAEIWAFTDVLNSLQGFFIFVLFLSNRRTRKILKNRHPRLYAGFRPVKNVFRKIRGVFVKKSKNDNSTEEGAVISREPSISSQFSELSEK